MRRSYFDVLYGDGSTCDDTGLEFESLDAAEYMAAQAAAEIGRDRLSAGDAREVTITVGSDRVDAPQRPQCATVEVLMSTT